MFYRPQFRLTRFVDSLPSIQRVINFDWNDIADTLRAYPGQWAELSSETAKATTTASQRIAHRINGGEIVPMPKGTFEAKTRQNVVYVRYIGEDHGREHG